MTQYAARRLLLLIPILIGVSVVVFLLVHLIPGDPARVLAGQEATREDIEAIRHRLGLDAPLHLQYFRFAAGLAGGDLGESIRTGRPVVEELRVRWPVTIRLTVCALVVMILLGVPAGIISATRPNSVFDNTSMMAALVGVSMPVFWLGLMLMLLFAYYLRLLPTAGSTTWKHFVLPALTLGLSSSAILARLTRSSMLEVMGQDFVRTAHAKGLAERVVIYKHALRNALIPVVTVVGLEFGSLLGGAVLTETVFTINGMGRYMVLSIGFRDYPVVQGAVLIFALGFVLVNLVVDLTYAVVDPRIRYR
ncbi:MAG: ABC transporter permease [Bacillota bacterium]|nr:ABC transporter permease [Bacillota bacterium]